MILALLTQKTKKELWRFLVIYRLWLPSFGIIVKPFYEALKGKMRVLLH